MNVEQVSKLLLIPIEILVRMRARRTGPPFHKVLTASGEIIYLYLKTELLKWMTNRTAFFITAGDAAELLGISRLEVTKISGFKGFDISFNRKYKGRLLINAAKNQFIWVPNRRKKRK